MLPPGGGTWSQRSSQLLRHQVGHGTGDRAQPEEAARVFLELYAFLAHLLDGAFESVDGGVEMALGDLQGGRLGLAHLLGDAVVFGFEIGVLLGLVADDRRVALVFAGIGSYVGEDTELSDVGVVFGVDALQFGMESGVSGAGETGIAFIDLDVGVPQGKWFRFRLIYLRYVL
jgi:hypothetical protein